MKNKHGASYNSGSEFSNSNDRIEATEEREVKMTPEAQQQQQTANEIAALQEQRATQTYDYQKFNKAKEANNNPFGNAASFRTQAVGQELDKTNYDLRSYERSMTGKGGPIVDGNGNVVTPGVNPQTRGNSAVTASIDPSSGINPVAGAPMSNGTGSARPSFSEGASMDIKKVSEGASMSDILFKKK